MARTKKTIRKVSFEDEKASEPTLTSNQTKKEVPASSHSRKDGPISQSSSKSKQSEQKSPPKAPTKPPAAPIPSSSKSTVLFSVTGFGFDLANWFRIFGLVSLCSLVSLRTSSGNWIVLVLVNQLSVLDSGYWSAYWLVSGQDWLVSVHWTGSGNWIVLVLVSQLDSASSGFWFWESPVNPLEQHASPPSSQSQRHQQEGQVEEITSNLTQLTTEKKPPFINRPEKPTPLFPRITIIELPKEKRKVKAPKPKRTPEVVEQNIFSTQPNIPFILEQLEVPMPSPSSSYSDKSYDVIELESGNLELHEVQKQPQVPSPTTKLPSTKVDKENKESEADTTVQEKVAQEVEAIVKETTEELQGELMKSPVKDAEAVHDIEVEKVHPTSAAATTLVAAQQPKEYVPGEELLDEVNDYAMQIQTHGNNEAG
ncbi:hypothetical protein L7F22_030739 [Adiantum nelumboides]|nr:hypothetical protein [Adiantum nelumboides]